MRTFCTFIALTLLCACNKRADASSYETFRQLHPVWRKAALGDSAAAEELGRLFWHDGTNGLRNASARHGWTLATSFTGASEAELFRLFDKADAGDRAARGQLAVIVYAPMFLASTNEEIMQLRHGK